MKSRKHDFAIAGGTGRRTMSASKNDGFEVGYKLIDPATGRPYTNAALESALKTRQVEYPALATIIEVELTTIARKAGRYPKAEFMLLCCGKDREMAEKRAKKELLPRLERLAKLLYRPHWESNIDYGSVKVEEYVHYMGDALYAGNTTDIQKHLLSALKSVVLPVIGTMRLCELDNETQEKLIRKINRVLKQKRASASFRGYAKRAYKGLFETIESSGYSGCAGGIRLADMITQTRRKNRALLNSVRTAHLDDNQRTALFTVLSEENLLYPLFITSLIYSGLETCEISALHFSEFEQLELENECCYTITVAKASRKLNKRYSSISATNDDFPIRRLRKVVLCPWAADVLLRYIEKLHSQGYADSQIAQMRLSDETPNGAIVGPQEIAEKMEPLLAKAGIDEIQIPRTRKDGSVYLKTEAATIETLYRDAQYVAEYCGADLPMLHAMFGFPRTETDEEAYLDLLSDEYAVARYLHLKRFSPFEQQHSKRHILKIENNTTEPQVFQIKSDYGIKTQWREITHDKND